uniref:cell division protein PerM n=1 Tax=Nocardioides sp. TaxID=35761 RepID=UPI00286EACB5
MTSLLLDRRDRIVRPRAQRPLVLIATLGGAAAALAPLLVCAAVGIVGWFAADAGAHGVPRDGMRMGAVAWLMAHGSGISVRGVAVGAVPLGLSAVCAWSMWRLGHRVGDSLSGHGPDADRISDGERDLTVPTAVGMFFVGYVVV